MYTALFAHIEKFVTLEASEIDLLESVLSLSNIKKKDHVLREGQVCNTLYFIVKGCMRQYIINSKGTEQTLQFGIESWWITDYLSYHNHVPSHFYIQAVEKSVVLYITQEKQEKLLEEFPVMERYFRFVYQRAYAAAQKRIKFLFSFSKEEFYFQAVRNHPEFIQRVPQYLIASYLGFTPEYLSEIRKRLLS